MNFLMINQLQVFLIVIKVQSNLYIVYFSLKFSKFSFIMNINFHSKLINLIFSSPIHFLKISNAYFIIIQVYPICHKSPKVEETSFLGLSITKILGNSCNILFIDDSPNLEIIFLMYRFPLYTELASFPSYCFLTEHLSPLYEGKLREKALKMFLMNVLPNKVYE